MSTHLILPGYQNSEAEHWQSYWERSDPARFRRVEQADWDAPQRPDWVATLDRAVADADAPVVLVAHSLGCITVAHWATGARPELTAKVLGALLVAPADIDTAEVPELVNFRPVPLAPLPFRTTVVASDDDPWCTADRARAFADAWGATFAAVGRGGHLNTASALGNWPQGRALLAELTA
ncbi:alpha/beta hydrolase [Kitasatospora sp. CMC57]|uniref:Alpha/beta hydrolase n=1 Tax=Kitasatospora sp. CMC57 TaxID=3231513 RepID=A0AB33JX30_9ACTN